MTREELMVDLEQKIKRISEAMDNGDYGCVDIETWEKFAKQLRWYEDILAALSEAN